jgi:hypothetical protein
LPVASFQQPAILSTKKGSYLVAFAYGIELAAWLVSVLLALLLLLLLPNWARVSWL